MSSANTGARLAPLHPTAINPDGTVPRTTVKHLLRNQGQINQLAAEQDLEILGLRADVDRLSAEVCELRATLNETTNGNHVIFLGAFLAMTFAGAFMFLGT
ncbi:hypothetical protein ACHAPI_010747 [Fusarium lateritium]